MRYGFPRRGGFSARRRTAEIQTRLSPSPRALHSRFPPFFRPPSSSPPSLTPPPYRTAAETTHSGRAAVRQIFFPFPAAIRRCRKIKFIFPSSPPRHLLLPLPSISFNLLLLPSPSSSSSSPSDVDAIPTRKHEIDGVARGRRGGGDRGDCRGAAREFARGAREWCIPGQAPPRLSGGETRIPPPIPAPPPSPLRPGPGCRGGRLFGIDDGRRLALHRKFGTIPSARRHSRSFPRFFFQDYTRAPACSVVPELCGSLFCFVCGRQNISPFSQNWRRIFSANAREFSSPLPPHTALVRHVESRSPQGTLADGFQCDYGGFVNEMTCDDPTVASCMWEIAPAGGAPFLTVTSLQIAAETNSQSGTELPTESRRTV